MMDEITTILSDVQDHLEKSVSELVYVDKDWGQLTLEMPAEKFPCALIDLKEINFTQTGNGEQVADTQIVVTVANLRLTSASLPAPNREDAYRIIGLFSRIHAALHLFSAGDYAPLFRTKLLKSAADSPYECYEMTYQTAHMVGFDTGGTATRVTGIKLELH